MAIDPTGADLKAFLTTAPDAPFVMLNLLRYAEGGREKYSRYLEATGPHLEKAGGRVVYFGKGRDALVAEEGQAWDTVLLVWYPSPRAFSQMVADPEYHEVSKLRSGALAEAVLQPTSIITGA